MRNTGIAGLAVVFLASCSTANTERAGPILYEAQGDGWDLRITADAIRLRERAGRSSSDYFGPLPSPIVEATGVRLEGELLREYVIAGLVEEDTRPYVMNIEERACRDARGRMWPTTITFNFFSDEHSPTGCGGPTLKLRSSAAPG